MCCFFKKARVYVQPCNNSLLCEIYICSLQPQPILQPSQAGILSVPSGREKTYSAAKTNSSDGGNDTVGCYLSKEQSTQLWTQIQQVNI